MHTSSLLVSNYEREPRFVFSTGSSSLSNHLSIHLHPHSRLRNNEEKYDRVLPTLPSMASRDTCGVSQYCVKAPFSTDVPVRQILWCEWRGRRAEWVPEMLGSDRDGWSVAPQPARTKGHLQPHAQNQHFSLMGFCVEVKMKAGREGGEEIERGGGGGGAWKPEYLADEVVPGFLTQYNVTISEQLNNSSWEIQQSSSRAVHYTRFSQWLMGEELSNITCFLWSLTWQHERVASLSGRSRTDSYIILSLVILISLIQFPLYWKRSHDHSLSLSSGFIIWWKN